MKNKPLLINEIFYSIQGEGRQVGLPFIFVRLSGCNLRCTYCDTTYAFKGGKRLSIPEVHNEIQKIAKTKNILITGGEPLLQRPTVPLIQTLLEHQYNVSIETHGEHPIHSVPKECHIIMDIKTPGSGMCRMGFIENLKFLKKSDEIKFVITTEEDYEWCKEIYHRFELYEYEVLFSPVNATSTFSPLNPQQTGLEWLAQNILKDQLPVRLQTQFHKIIWGNECQGR